MNSQSPILLQIQMPNYNYDGNNDNSHLKYRLKLPHWHGQTL